MQHFIYKTEKIAYDYFRAFSFEELAIEKLLEIGIKDVSNDLIELKHIIEAESLCKEALHHTLHSLKGVLSQLGNHQIIKQIEAIEACASHKEIHQKTLCLFFIHES